VDDRDAPQAVLVPTEQATVPFYGHELVAVRLPDGRIAAVLRWLCEGMGIDVQAQVRRIRRKRALRDDLVVVQVVTGGGPQAMPALGLHGLPGWLYGIDETRLDNPEAQEGVVRFQAEATDVLYRHFAHRPQQVATLTALVPAVPVARPDAPDAGAEPSEWLRYHQQMVAFLEWQADVERWRGSIESRLESVEEVARLVPEILERLGPQGLTPAHQSTVQTAVKRLHDLSGIGYASVYGELNHDFHVGKYTEIPDAQWSDVAAWFKRRLDAATTKRGPGGTSSAPAATSPLFPDA
jgi:hypothetical protein